MRGGREEGRRVGERIEIMGEREKGREGRWERVREGKREMRGRREGERQRKCKQRHMYMYMYTQCGSSPDGEELPVDP